MARKKTKEEWSKFLQDDLDYRIAQLFEDYKDKSWGDFLKALDQLKESWGKRWKQRVEGQ